MSFEPNDMNTIHLGNYEEFFILYMDNELTEDQVKMVDEFLVANPDLKAEFEILMSTRLPLEDFSFDKKDLLADSMKQTLVDEELLLYIDNELPSDKKKTVELEIASNKDYQLQHQLLLQIKLDLSEKIEYPNKKELYRGTERVIAMKVWMRVAAAVVIIAVGGIVYLQNSPRTIPSTGPSTADVKKNPVQQTETKKTNPEKSGAKSSDNFNNDQVAITNPPNKKEQPNKKEIEIKQEKTNEPVVAKNETPQTEDVIPRNRTTDVMFDGDKTTALVEPKVSINKADVTSPLLARNTVGMSDNSDEPDDRKGSVKGFLRKATRMIEKRTGIDPTNENGELLIGAVAINLK
jgi:hypothetical protein